MLTKTDLQQIENLIKFHQDDLREDLGNKITEFKSDVLSAIDEVMGELKRSREEQEVQSYKLSNHEDRIVSLEAKASPSV